jgi:hypothetical protein
MSELNLQASKKAVKYSAFDSAAMFASKGIDLLAKGDWGEENKVSSLELYSLAVEVDNIIGSDGGA